MRHTLTSLVLTSISISALGLCLNAQTAFSSDFQSPRTAGLGGAGHAAPMLTDSIYLNPSFTSLLHGYLGSFIYEYYKGGDQQPDGSHPIHGRVLNIAVQDGRSELFQAGVGYTVREDAKYLNFGASKALLHNLGVGLGGKFIFPNTGNGDKAQDFNISSTYVFNPWVQAALMADNLTNSDADHAQGLYREIILGTKINIQNLMLIYFDPHLAPDAPGSDFGHETGIELAPMSDLFFRFGMFRASNVPELQNARGRGFGFGVGWLAPRLSLDYALKRTLEPVVNNTHNFGMTVYF
jgi:hypothetical protein